MHHVFISYSRRESEWVTALVEELARRGVRVWIDTADIRISAPWFEEVTDAITEADLFLICDSERWRASLPCNTEAERAAAVRKAMLRVPVGTNVGETARTIVEGLGHVPAAQRLRTELATLARDWDRTGRPRSALASRRQVARLRKSVRDFQPSPIERTFLRFSRAQSRRRTLVAGAIVLVMLASFLGIAFVKAAQKRVEQQNDALAVLFARNERLRFGRLANPILALATAARLGGNESFENADYISDAFRQPPPDDAFHTPVVAQRFAGSTIGAEVTVVAADGRAWRRGAAARSVRIASPVGRARIRSERHRAGDLHLTLGNRAIAAVFRHRTLLRRIHLRHQPAAAVISPDGRLLAVAQGNAVDLIDIESGQTRVVLRGATAIRDLAWSSDGNDVWALGRGIVTRWRVREGLLLDAPGQHFEALLPAADPGRIWVVTRSGSLDEISVASGERRRSLHVPDAVTAAAGSPDGSVAALSGRHGLWIVRLNGSSVDFARRLRLPSCRLGRAAFASSQSFAVPCLGGSVLRISTRTGRVTQRLSVNPTGAFAVKFLPRSGLLLVSDQYATLYVVDRNGHARNLFEAPCGGSISRIAVASDDSAIVPVGAGTGLVGCLSRLQRTGSDEASTKSWRTDAGVADDVPSAVAETAAVSRGGNVFAYGYDDGSIVLHPMTNITPTLTVTGVVGTIRDMLVTPANQLVVATEAGVVQRIRLCETCVSDRALAALARRIVGRERALGVIQRPRAGTVGPAESAP